MKCSLNGRKLVDSRYGAGEPNTVCYVKLDMKCGKSHRSFQRIMVKISHCNYGTRNEITKHKLE